MATKKTLNPLKQTPNYNRTPSLESVKRKQDAAATVQKQKETRNYLEKEFNNRGGSYARIVNKTAPAAPAKKTTAKGAWTQAEKEAAMRERRAAAQAQGKGNWNAEAEMKKRREAAMAKKKRG